MIKRLPIVLSCLLLPSVSEGSSLISSEIIEFEALKAAISNSIKCTEYCNRWPNENYPHDVDRKPHPTFPLSKETWWSGCLAPALEASFVVEVPATLMIMDKGAIKPELRELRARVVKLSELVQEKRTDKDATVKALFRVLCNQPYCDELIELFRYFDAWLSKYPADADLVILNDHMTMGQKIDLMMQDKSRRPQVFLAALILQKYRRGSYCMLMALFRDFASQLKNESGLNELKTWLINAGPYVPESLPFLDMSSNIPRNDQLAELFERIRCSEERKNILPSWLGW